MLVLLFLASTPASATDPVDAPETEETEAASQPLRPGTPTPGSPHYDLELLYTSAQFDEGLSYTRARMEQFPDDSELPWHAGRFMFEIGERVEKGAATYDKEAYYAEMLVIAEAGLVQEPDNPHLLFARGIAKGRLGTTQGILSSLFMASDIENDWLAVEASGFIYSSLGGEEILPCDVYMALGSYYRMVPDWWIIEAVAGTRGDKDKAMDYLERADRCAPGRIETVKELGVAQICTGQARKDDALVQAGLAHLNEAAAITPMKPTDHIDHEHVARLLADPSQACEYSRDGQADLDKRILDAQ